MSVPHSDKGKVKRGGCTARRDMQQLNVTGWMFTHWHERILKRVHSERKYKIRYITQGCLHQFQK